MPCENRVEPVVERRVRVDGVEPDAVPQCAQAGQGGVAFGGGEVVEDRLGHQEVGRPCVELGLERREAESRVEREVDVVAQEHGAGRRLFVERGEAIPTFPGGSQQLAIVLQVEAAGGHAASTSTWSRRAAASARASASIEVSAVAIT